MAIMLEISCQDIFRLNLNLVYESRNRNGIRKAAKPVVVIFFFFYDHNLIVIIVKETEIFRNL